MYSFNLGSSSLLHNVTDDPMSSSAGTMQFPMAIFTVGLRSPPYLIELSRLQQVRMLWGRALPKILPSSRFPTLTVPTLLDCCCSLDHNGARNGARGRNFHKSNHLALGNGVRNPTLERLVVLWNCRSWTGTVLVWSYAALSCNRVHLSISTSSSEWGLICCCALFTDVTQLSASVTPV